MKFSVFKKNNPASGASNFSFLGTDLHSHLIPGIDDGVPDMETAVSLISSLYSLGYQKIITTPHIMQGYYPNDATTILEGCRQVQQALLDRGIPVQFQAAAEYFLDTGLIEAIQNSEPLLKLSGNKLLVEISFAAPPIQLHEFLYHLQLKGYEPVIAHPERYKYYHQDPEQYMKLIDIGCELQLNLLSLTGYYGKDVRKAAFKLLDKKWIAYLATDLHHQRHADGLRRLLQDHALVQRLQDIPFKNTEL